MKEFITFKSRSKLVIEKKIGIGTFGFVFQARNLVSGDEVAVKKAIIKWKQDDIPDFVLLEAEIMNKLKHRNIIKLHDYEVFHMSRDERFLYIVMEKCPFELARLISNKNLRISLNETKSITSQLMNGVYYIHSEKFFHRDLKPNNLLITSEGILKIIDFGMAAYFKMDAYGNPWRQQPNVGTMWYRAPELLLREYRHTCAVDVWSCGLTLTELWNRKPLLQGTSNEHQFKLIDKRFGPIDERAWPGVKRLALFKQWRADDGESAALEPEVVPSDVDAVDLIWRMLRPDPAARITAEQALAHPFLFSQSDIQPLKSLLARYSSLSSSKDISLPR